MDSYTFIFKIFGFTRVSLLVSQKKYKTTVAFGIDFCLLLVSFSL